MSLPSGISLLIDFAFKLAFGRENHVGPLISLLNAILNPVVRIVELELLNPFGLQEFQDDKSSILDIKARDANGAYFNIEMQIATIIAIEKRMTYYGCSVYRGQLQKGDNYSELRAVYAICLLDDYIWQSDPAKHHRFELMDRQTGRVLEETLEIHFLELPKYNLAESELRHATAIERWVYLIRNAQNYSLERLRELFPDPEFQAVIDTVEEIQMKTEYRGIYDDREKAKLDEAWRIAAAERKGRQEGEIIGIEKGMLAGQVQTYQQILGGARSSDEELLSKPPSELESMIADFQRRLRLRKT